MERGGTDFTRPRYLWLLYSALAPDLLSCALCSRCSWPAVTADEERCHVSALCGVAWSCRAFYVALVCLGVFITPPEATNTVPRSNRGSGGGARGCGFEERVTYSRKVTSYSPRSLSPPRKFRMSR